MAHITKVEAVGDLTVQFTLDQANVAFPGLLAGNAGYLAAPSSWAAGAATMTNPRSAAGPSSSSPRASSCSSATPRTGGRAPRARRCPYLDKMTFDPLPDSTARIPAVKRRQGRHPADGRHAQPGAGQEGHQPGGPAGHRQQLDDHRAELAQGAVRRHPTAAGVQLRPRPRAP